ncbi:MAG: class I SAM-dependent DNA methyltransferase, partial [Nitrososphaerales archaeon]
MFQEHVEAARAFYDASAERYVQFVGTEISSATEGPVDQSLLVAFIELIKGRSVTRVADVGCGTGRVAAFMAARGLDVVGVDVSPAMLAVARIAHPGIEFEEGRLDKLPFGEGALAGVVCWYSIIYTPPERLGEAFAELTRVLDAAGHLLIAFQAGSGEPVQRPGPQGTTLCLTSYRHSMGSVIRYLQDAGLQIYTTALREPELDHESNPQAFLIARNPKPNRGRCATTRRSGLCRV